MNSSVKQSKPKFQHPASVPAPHHLTPNSQLQKGPMRKLSTRALMLQTQPRLFVALLFLVVFITVSAQANAQPAEKTATVYGAKIHYVEAGSGPAVILLH